MRKATPCAKCGSLRTFGAPIIIGSSEGTREPYIEVHEHPNALLFKGPHKGTVRAWICGNCGYTELYTTSAQALYNIYHRAQTKLEREEAERMQRPSALLLRPAAAHEDAEPKQLLRPSNEIPEEKDQTNGD